jgi:ATP-dependent Clp protease adaptor protein ClpS
MTRLDSEPLDPLDPANPLDSGREEDLAVERRPRTRRPRRYRVLLHNDDYTTMEFVVWILMTVFHHAETEATQIMLHVHRKGVGVAGVYPHEVAETRVSQVHELAKQHEFPLRCSIEET